MIGWKPVPHGLLDAFFITITATLACVPSPDTVTLDIDVADAGIDALLGRHTSSHVDTGCDMRILTDGPESLDAFIALIDSAQHHLHVETLNFDDDSRLDRDLATEFAARFAGKAREGVEVRVILDPVVQDFYARPETRQVLGDGGVDVRDYALPTWDPPSQLLFRAHKKLLIADGRRAIIGGANYGLAYFGEGLWRDTNVLLTGPVVATLQQEFLRDWALLGGPVADTTGLFPALEPTGDLSVRAIDQRPALGDFDMNHALLIAIRSAKREILIEAPYFNPTEWLAEEIIAAADQGVAVTLLTNSRASVDVETAYFMTAYWFDRLIDRGVRVFLWDTGQTLHAKSLVVDDRLAMIMSHNLNHRSIVWDTENGVIVTDPAGVSDVRRVIEADLATPGVFEIDRCWLDAVSDDERTSWYAWRAFAWLF